MKKIKIEICLESVESVIAAREGGADRVEFCSDLFEGGLTPTLGAFRTARKLADIPINVMIRPRGGDFLYSAIEYRTMKEDLHIFREEGADGIVLGFLNPDGTIDEERTAECIAMAAPLPVTFHRAFDMTPDAEKSLETLVGLGAKRILTSGLEPSVMEGIRTLKKLVKLAAGRIIIMPGCGINERNFEYVKQEIQAEEYHIYLPKTCPSAMVYRPLDIAMGGILRQEEFMLTSTDPVRVKNITGK